MDFIFDCPCLGEKGCNVYEGQPFMCRAYGYGSTNSVELRSCTYFTEQIKAANDLTHERKVINIFQLSKFAELLDKKLIKIDVIAPIPVWFAQSHEETLKKIKAYSESQPQINPLINLWNKLFSG